MSVIYNKEEYKVFDFHVHTFPDKIADGAVSKLQQISGITPITNGTLSDTIQTLPNIGVDKALLLNIATSPRQQTTINNTAKENNDLYYDWFTSFGSVHFQAPDCLDELERIKSLGIKGIKLHPDYQGFMIDDPLLYPVYERCSELNLPIIFHAGWDCYSPNLVHAPPKLTSKILSNFPKLTVILAHFGGLKMWDDVEEYLIGKDVYLDTSMCASFADKSEINRLINNHDSKKILLGSDCPWEDTAKSIEFILSMNLSKEVKEDILFNNASALLNSLN